MTDLCSYCVRIPFQTLACPLSADVAAAQVARKHGRKFRQFLPIDDHDHSKLGPNNVLLGSLDRMQKSSSRCKLCRIFYNVIRRQGSVYMHDRPTPTDERAVFYAEAKYYGFVTVSPLDGEGNTKDCYFFLRRLCLKGVFRDVVTGQEDLHGFAYLNNIAQPYQPDMDMVLENQKMLFGGRIRSQTIDLDMLRRWIQICDTQHELTCTHEDDNDMQLQDDLTLSLIRLIDVRQNCLRVFRNVRIDSLNYTALSYVWGRNQTSRLLKENEKILEQQGSLADFGLLKTLVDSIALTRALDIDFIWIDVLCILQDDPDDISLQIGNVGRIYSNAKFTIIASGMDADAGLPGFRPGTRTFQQEEVEVIPSSAENPGLSLLTTCKRQRTHWEETAQWTQEEIDSCKWNTRGWTLQERVLSKRSLMFAQDQVYWVCDGGIFCEESHFEHPEEDFLTSFMDTPLRFEFFPVGPLSTLAMKSLDGPLTSYTNTSKLVWKKYASLVRDHSRRDLTNPGDIYGSFRAISDAFSKLNNDNFHWGHPRSRFESSLSWRSGYSSVGLRRRLKPTTLKMTSLHEHVVLPSWSWMGWVGPVDFSVTDEKLEYELPTITCFVHKSAPLRVMEIYRPQSIETNPTDEEELKPPKPTKHEPISWEDISNHIPLRNENRLSRIPDEHVIFFWTSSAFFKVDPPTGIRKYAGAHEYRGAGDDVQMKDDEGVVIGTLSKMSSEEGESAHTEATREEFVAIGKRHAPDLASPENASSVIALQIRWEKDVAYRVNIAEIDQAAWENAKPIRKLIALQ